MRNYLTKIYFILLMTIPSLLFASTVRPDQIYLTNLSDMTLSFLRHRGYPSNVDDYTLSPGEDVYIPAIPGSIDIFYLSGSLFYFEVAAGSCIRVLNAKFTPYIQVNYDRSCGSEG